MFAYGLTYPLSIISTRLQVQRKQGGDQTLGKIIAAEGWKGLYGGLKAGLFGVAISQGIYYYWYAWFRRVLIENRRVKGKAISATWETIMSLIVASLAGAICTVATNPIWVVNTRMQVAMKEGNKLKENATTKDTIKEIYEKNGITGFWKGIIPALILVSNPVIQYVVFEKLKGIVEKKEEVRTTRLLSVRCNWKNSFYFCDISISTCQESTSHSKYNRKTGRKYSNFTPNCQKGRIWGILQRNRNKIGSECFECCVLIPCSGKNFKGSSVCSLNTKSN